MWSFLFSALVFAQAVGFSAALERAENVPSVQAQRDAGQERAREARGLTRLTENPVIQVQPGGRSLRTGGAGAEFYMSVTQNIPLNRLGKKRQEAVRREVERDLSGAVLALRDARLRIAQAWLLRWSAQELHAIAEAEAALALELARELGLALSAGEATRVDLGLVEGFRAESLLVALSYQGAGFEAGVELARAMGLVSELPVAAEGELPHIDVPQEDALRKALEAVGSTAEVRFFRRAEAAERARLSEARAQVGPQLGIGALGFREGGGDVAGVALFELVLPVFERGKRESSQVAAQLAAAEQNARRALIDAHGERVRVIHDVVYTEQVVALVEHQLLAAAERVADAQRKRLNAREATTQDWVLARRAVLRARIELTQGRAAYALSRFRARELISQLESQK